MLRTPDQQPAVGSRLGHAFRVAALTLAVAGLVTAVAFAASTDFVERASSPEPVGVGPRGMIAADLDGDGDRDLATANISGGNVTVLRNNGAANFVEPASSPEPAGSFPTALAVGDLDGDTDQDLVVGNQSSGDVNILRNTGAGNFVEPASSPELAGTLPVSIAVGDLDGDNDRDLAIANATEPVGTVTILRNNGNGNFFEPATSPESVGNKAISVAAADLDGDGDLDLGVANQQSGNVTILRNNGSANFTEPATSPETAASFPQGITAVDIDGDTDDDLVVVNQGTNNMTVLRNNGSGNFSEPGTSPVPLGMRPLGAPAAGDFDGDGDQDLAAPNHDSDDVTVLRNAGSGGYAEVGTSPEGAGDGPQSIVAKDLDGDSDPDLAVSNSAGAGTVTIFRNR